MVCKEVASFNQNAGTITIETISDSVRSAFSKRIDREFAPRDVVEVQTDYAHAASKYGAEQTNALALASLVGEWNENTEGDREAIKKLIEDYD